MTKLLALPFASPNPVLALTPSLPRTLTLLLALTLTLTLPLTLTLALTLTLTLPLPLTLARHARVPSAGGVEGQAL